jgi:hypothetical protein
MESEDKAAPKRDPLEVLKGFGGILPGKVIFATPPVYKEVYPNQPDKWPVYKIKPSDGLDFNENLDKQDWYRIEEGMVLPIPGKIRIDKFKKHLLDWKNHRDGDEEIPFPRGQDGRITDAGIMAMKPALQIWILEVISEADLISKEESEGLKF